MKQGALAEDRGGATEAKIRAQVQAVQGQSESAEKCTKMSSRSCIPRSRVHCTAVRVSSKTKPTRKTRKQQSPYPLPPFSSSELRHFERTNNVHVNANRVETGFANPGQLHM